MTDINVDLRAVIDAVEIESAARYFIHGVPREVPDTVPAGTAVENELPRLISALAEDIYNRLYIRPSTPGVSAPDALAERELAAALSAANTGQGSWETGWTVRRIEMDGRVVVARDKVEFWAPGSGVRACAGDTIRPGAKCRVWVAKEQRGLVPGFYLAIGDGDANETDSGENNDPQGRLYWHLMPQTAARFIAVTTALLNGSEFWFRAKVLSNPDAYYRADAGVIYFRRRDDSRIGEIVGRIHSAIATGLRPDVPLFTKRLAGGLGFAEDPSDSLSFGEHRCRMVAESLWRSFLLRDVGREARAATLAAAFQEKGFDAARPYLGAESSHGDPRLLALAETTAAGACVSPKKEALVAPRQTDVLSEIPLELAVRIGEQLCQSAFWDRGGSVCNWVGRATSERAKPGGPITPTALALGPDVYCGSAGIALFLAQLHALAPDARFRRTAAGAIARSILQFGRSPPKEPLSALSYFSGDLGAGYVASRVAKETEHVELSVGAESILDRVVEGAARPHMFDVIGGNAGAIPALLWLSRVPAYARCRSLAMALGEELCATAARSAATCHWQSNTESDSRAESGPLLGFSHGAAGMGLALLELHGVTGRADFRETARGAFAYVDSQFDRKQGNWPDVELKAEAPGAGVTPNFSVAWCHGAPGIALARLRAAALDPDCRENHVAMARLGIETTLRAIEKSLEYPRADTSLCHGLAGLGEVLLFASEALGDSSYKARAVALAETLIARHGASGDWPSGVVSGGPNPSLMLGLAGVGYWLLRLHNPTRVPSPLILIPSAG
jgi:hypothetical protein